MSESYGPIPCKFFGKEGRVTGGVLECDIVRERDLKRDRERERERERKLERERKGK